MKAYSIVGILNATPDSYFDGGIFNAKDKAVRRVGELLEQGADIIDIGGESTGPKSKDVSVDEELSRVMPIIEAIITEYPAAKLSIDTYKADVAQAATAAGVRMINDVTAGRGDTEMFNVMAQSNALVVLMYSKDSTARTSVADTEYTDVIATISTFLMEQVIQAKATGISANQIIIDPGMGHFISAKPEYSFEVIRRLRELKPIAPVYLSPSRKSFLAGPKNLPAEDRLPATIAASITAVQNGAMYIRTHDVLEVRRACEIAVQL